MVWRYTTKNCIRVWKWYIKVGPVEIVKNAALGCVKIGSALLPLIAIGPAVDTHKPAIINVPQIRSRGPKRENSPYEDDYNLAPGELIEETLPYVENKFNQQIYSKSIEENNYPLYPIQNITSSPTPNSSVKIPNNNYIPEPNSGFLLVFGCLAMGFVLYLVKKYKGE